MCYQFLHEAEGLMNMNYNIWSYEKNNKQASGYKAGWTIQWILL